MECQRHRKPNADELRTARHQMWTDAIRKIGGKLIQWGGIGYWVYCARDVGIEWAGKWTVADVDVRVDTGTPWVLGVIIACLLLAISGWVYGMAQARLRRRTIRDLEAPRKARELEIDPRRSSSQLTPSGETPPEEG